MKRSFITYMEHNAPLADNTQRNIRAAYRSFPGLDGLIASNPDHDDLYGALQKWISGNALLPRTAKSYFGIIRQYLNYRGIRLDPLDAKQNLRFSTVYEEELHPLSRGEIVKVLKECSGRRRMLYLAQISSGMRIGELVRLQGRHIRTDAARLTVKIPPQITKKRRGRTTFFSSEVAGMLLPILRTLGESDPVFLAGTISNAAANEAKYMKRAVLRAGLGERYETNRRLKITTHSFRAFFITQMSRHDPNLAKMLSGQKGYMLQYDRLTDEEKLAKYIKFEPDLLIMGGTPPKNEVNTVDRLLRMNEGLLADNRRLAERNRGLLVRNKGVALRNKSLIHRIAELEGTVEEAGNAAGGRGSRGTPARQAPGSGPSGTGSPERPGRTPGGARRFRVASWMWNRFAP